MRKAVILAGGEGTRLRPLTNNIPKAMVPVLNRPFLEHVVKYLKRHGIGEIILAVGKSHRKIEDTFADGAQLGVKIIYSVEEFALGTAGAVKNAGRFLDDSFVVLNGDVFTDVDLNAMIQWHKENAAMVTIALTPVDNPTVYGIVETDNRGRVKGFVEKPGWDRVTTNMVNAGIYVVEPGTLEYIVADSYSMFERDVFPMLIARGCPVYGYPSQGYWIDIGTPQNYLKLHHDLLYRNLGSGIQFDGKSLVHPSAHVAGPVLIGEGCVISENVVVRGPAALGAGCWIGEEAEIEGAILWCDCRVSKGARLRNCVLASGCCVEEESEIPDGCVLGERALVAKEQKLWPGVKI
jgi:mannose-1-phosphate guanylyltransferase